MTKLYEKFLIYKAILNKVSLTAISEKLNISRNVIYKVKKEGLIKIKDKERIVLNFIEKDPFKNIDEIALETNLNKIFIYRTLKKYGIITFRQPSKKILEIIEFLINEKNYNELKKLLTFQFLIPYKVFKNLETDDLELKFYKLGYDIYHSQKSSDELLSEIESYLNELKSQNKIFTFYKALILKIDVLILKKCFDEIIEIYNENIEHLISLSLRVMFYRAFSNAYSFKEDFKKAFYFIKKIKKVH
jgi:DNA-binding phage protein